MHRRILLLLNVKLNEAALVRKLFTVQFFLGVATAFYFTSTLTMFLSTYKIEKLPIVYLLSAGLLFGFNRLYSHFDEKVNSPRLLEMVTIFSAGSIFAFWVLLNFLDFHILKIIIAAWYLVIYMLVGYAFWGMASIMFNVRESKRLFSIVGAGDVPAKMLGYFSVSALSHYVSVYDLLWISIASFVLAFFLMKRYQRQGFIVATDPNMPHPHADKEDEPSRLSTTRSILKRFFYNRLILSIAILSVLSYVVFAFVDFTFLTDIKLKFKNSEQIATFIGIFFAVGRFLAICIKLLFSSRMIARMGLSNALLVTPVLLLLINVFIQLPGGGMPSLFIFGTMVLVAEVLRSTLQEPVFFILFQPLHPHDRLRGHLVAKGYTMPVALLGVGAFLYLYMRSNHQLPINMVSQILLVFLAAWIASIYLIKKEYLQTLVNSLHKGYFTGAELFLNNREVTELLISKTKSGNPVEVIHSLNLLERSRYADMPKLLLQHLQSDMAGVRQYVLSRVIENNLKDALPLIKKLIQDTASEPTNPALIQAFYFLEEEDKVAELLHINDLNADEKKPAILGLLRRRNPAYNESVKAELIAMATQTVADKLLVLDIIMEAAPAGLSETLTSLLLDANPGVYRKAIEACGKIRAFTLLNEVIEVAANRQAFPVLRKSIQHYGDEVFSFEFWTAGTLPPVLVPHIIAVAGRIKGDHSTNFLLSLLRKDDSHTDKIIEALWMKKAVLQGEDLRLTDDWVRLKIEQSREKIVYFNELENNKPLTLLQEAISSDLRYDLQLLLYGFALLYDRKKVDRVIELLAIERTSRVYNAIEVLELILPNKYFTHLNMLVELMNDIRQKQVLIRHGQVIHGTHVLEDILTNNKANFSEWTRSVACFLLPKVKGKISPDVLGASTKTEEVLFNETRRHVLSMLN